MEFGDDAAADAHLTRSPCEHDGADRDVELGVARGRDQADRAGIDAARLTLQFADDLHGANLRRAGDRAARKQRAQHVLEPHIGSELGDDAGGHLVHRAIGLDREQVGDLDRADLGNAAEIVAQEIDNHEILGALLFIDGEPGLEAGVFARRASPGRRALHRARRDVLALAAEEEFGRERKHVERASVDEGAVGHALLAPERRIKRDRIAGKVEAIFQREIDLIDVARGDVVLHPGEGIVIVLARPGQLEAGDRGLSLGAPRLEPGAGAGIVERPRRAEEPEPEQRNASVAGQEALELRLEAIAKLVGEEARDMEAGRQSRLDLFERELDLVGRAGHDDAFGVREEQAAAGRSEAVVKKDVW